MRMLKYLALLTVFLPTHLYADEFGPNDKVLYFNANVLLEVITRNFPENLRLDVANKYTSVMDTNGNVSIADLTEVCIVGRLDSNQCRNFIQDLISTAGDETLAPFYWADYVRYSIDGDVYNSNQGFNNERGQWTLQYPWMIPTNNEGKLYQNYYPRVQCRQGKREEFCAQGISACTSESGTIHVADSTKNFIQGEKSGNHWQSISQSGIREKDAENNAKERNADERLRGCC